MKGVYTILKENTNSVMHENSWSNFMFYNSKTNLKIYQAASKMFILMLCDSVWIVIQWLEFLNYFQFRFTL